MKILGLHVSFNGFSHDSSALSGIDILYLNNIKITK